MDKYEYNLRNEEINALITRREFKKAVEIADTIDWTKVRSVKTLCKISDLYKVNRKYNEAKILLEQALNRCPNGKSIVSSLCEVCIKMGDVVSATEYYKLFVQIAPTDNAKFILLYKIYEAQEVSLDERIGVLEELKKRERVEKWCYELAYLYHRVGLASRCVEECDDLILWFSQGKYVKKAMELKMLHQALSPSQEAIYQQMISPVERASHVDQTVVHNAADEVKHEDDALVKTVDVGQYSTINIQKALEESIRDTMGDNPQFKSGNLVEPEVNAQVFDNTDYINETVDQPIVEEVEDSTVVLSDPSLHEKHLNEILAPMLQDTGEMQEIYIDTATGELELDELTEAECEADIPAEAVKQSESSVSFDTQIYNKGDIPSVINQTQTPAAEPASEVPARNLDNASKEELMNLIDKKVAEAMDAVINGRIPASGTIGGGQPPKSMQQHLTEEADGQISLVVPDEPKIDKQITGQIDIESYLSEWENSKKEKAQRTEEELKARVKEETGNLFSDFEAAARDDILKKLENELNNGPSYKNAEEEYREYLNKVHAEEEAKKAEEESASKTESEEAKLEAELKKLESKPENEAKATELKSEKAVEENNISEPTESKTADDESEIESEGFVSFEEFASEPIVSKNKNTDTATEEESDKSIETEAEADTVGASSDDDKTDSQDVSRDEEDNTVRQLTSEELALFQGFIQTKKGKTELAKSLDNISLASYTGNVCVIGDSAEEALSLAKNVIQYAKTTDSNFAGKVGKVSGESLNGKDVAATVERMQNGGLIVEKASGMDAETVEELVKTLNQENQGILVILQDGKRELRKLLKDNEKLAEIFNVEIEIEQLSDDALVAYGRQYAEHEEYAIDEMGILALHTRIDEMQTSDHIVTVADVRELVDDAIYHATRFSPKHVLDIILGKRYDEDDMIILKERDFNI
ncbi:tetratricopeptide repeat protein [Lacrimispora saccharolytica]|uniref:tetratricopeptide repeat protein n=1 Tax=Lacrimispora saccharolytica TaxID=84030 RepID=UPI00265CC21F|nr:hypothetical protein [Lacrimispora saccharolytica]MCF2657120.1 hypothetical protein [Lacrimispora saccharolytica]